MNLCPKCNKNKSYPNELCKICNYWEWALAGTDGWPQEDIEENIKEMKKSISYQGAVLGQELSVFGIDIVEGFATKINILIGWYSGDK